LDLGYPGVFEEELEDQFQERRGLDRRKTKRLRKVLKGQETEGTRVLRNR